MATIHDSYLGVAEESTYATGVAPTRFFEMPSDGISGKYERIESESFRAGQRVLHKDRWALNPKGAEGGTELEMQDGAFGLLLKHALGAVVTGTPSGGFTPHTFTVGSLTGKSLTVQVGRVDNAGTIHAFTYEGGKVKSWELSCAVDGILKFKPDFDFARETIGSALGGIYVVATPTYHATSQLLTFVGSTVEIGGVDFGVSDLTIKGENGLKTDRYYSSGAVKREPLEEGMRTFEVELKGEFEGLAHAQRVAASITSGALADIVATWSSPQGGSLTVTLTDCRFDGAGVNFDGAKIIEQPIKAKVLWDGSTSPVTALYDSVDATP